MFKRIIMLCLVSCCFIANTMAAPPAIGDEPTKILYVDKNDNDSFNTIQSAIDASSPFKSAIILISPGVYKEKIYITRNNLSLVGSSQRNTLIEYAELRNNWRKDHVSDWGAAVINIAGSDITIANLEVVNNYGRKNNTLDHQFAIRGFEDATRIILHQCTVTADGADTLSLWNKEDGMYYHSYCSFTGATDMVCPRGTALIEHSKFYNLKQTATLWHDGELDEEQKFVVAHSEFDGVKDFWLGRHHYDAQFYLYNNKFSKNLADKSIFRKTYPQNPSKNRENRYGDRYYFLDNETGQTLPWFNNNMSTQQQAIFEDKSLEQWVFKGEWAPKKVLSELQNIIKHNKFKTDRFNLK